MSQKQRYTSRLSVYLLLIKDNEILLSLRQNTGYADNMFTVPAGHVEEEESIKAAMVRETHEEAGITIDQNDLKLAHIMYRKSNHPYVEFYWTCSKWSGEITNMEPEKCAFLKFFPIDKLPDSTTENLKQVLKNITEKSYFSETGWE